MLWLPQLRPGLLCPSLGPVPGAGCQQGPSFSTNLAHRAGGWHRIWTNKRGIIQNPLQGCVPKNYQNLLPTNQAWVYLWVPLMEKSCRIEMLNQDKELRAICPLCHLFREAQGQVCRRLTLLLSTLLISSMIHIGRFNFNLLLCLPKRDKRFK